MPNPSRMRMAAAGSAGGEDYELWSWGGGWQGRLGHGDVVSKSSPVQVGALSDWGTEFAIYKNAVFLFWVIF